MDFLEKDFPETFSFPCGLEVVLKCGAALEDFALLSACM
jgi:hypothetical protein